MAATATVANHAIFDSDTSQSFQLEVTSAMTPELAVNYIGELSNDIRDVVVISNDEQYSFLAGDRDLYDGLVKALKLTPDATQLEVKLARGSLYTVRTERYAVAAVAGRFALPALVLHDLRFAAQKLEATHKND